jgi:AmmeMemoRadiSam system protein A
MSSHEGSGTTEPGLALEEQQALLEVARSSIEHGLRHFRPLPVQAAAHSERLRREAASFVTLKLRGRLRGCVGALEPRYPLVIDVAESAFGAAFRDPRFDALGPSELEALEVSISVLSPLERLDVTSEAALVETLRPGLDGLLLREAGRQGTFLPAVWADLEDPRKFVREVKRKAGLPDDYWSSTLEVCRYSVESFS